jgi:chaperonin GroES
MSRLWMETSTETTSNNNGRIHFSRRKQQRLILNAAADASTTTTTTTTTSSSSSSSSPSTRSSGSSSTYTLDGVEIRGPITPLRNFILVKVKDTLTATAGGILLPDQSKERPTEGLVLAAGPGKVHPFTAIRIPNPIQSGMSVLYGKFDGITVLYNDDSCQMIRDDDVLLYYEGLTMKLDNVIPVRDYVLLALDENPETLATTSGVVIANQVVKDDVPCEGTVIKVGEGRMASTGQLTTPPVQVGDRVKFKDYAGNDVTLDGKPYSVVKMVDILCSLNDNVQTMHDADETNNNDEAAV